MDDKRYEKHLMTQSERYEGACKRCGECCGSTDGDPCANLDRDTVSGRYFCRSYDDRLGPQKTLSGRMFNCVPIRDIIRQGLLRPNCAYNKVSD